MRSLSRSLATSTNSRRIGAAWLFLAGALLFAVDAQAAFNVTVGSTASSGGSWIGDTWTPSASPSTVLAAEVEAHLANGPTVISTAGGGGEDGNNVVSAAVSWSANALILRADHDITIDAALSGAGTATLVLEYGLGELAAGNTATYQINTFVSLRSNPDNPTITPNFSIKRGSDGVTEARAVPTCTRTCSFLSGSDYSALDIMYGTIDVDGMADTDIWIHVNGHNLLGVDLFPDAYYAFVMGCDGEQGTLYYPNGALQSERHGHDHRPRRTRERHDYPAYVPHVGVRTAHI